MAGSRRVPSPSCHAEANPAKAKIPHREMNCTCSGSPDASSPAALNGDLRYYIVTSTALHAPTCSLMLRSLTLLPPVLEGYLHSPDQPPELFS